MRDPVQEQYPRKLNLLLVIAITGKGPGIGDDQTEMLLYPVSMSKSGALLMLIVAALWAVSPASVCLLAWQAHAQPSCCQSMAQNCPMQQFGANDACCIMHGKDAATPPEGPLSLQDGFTSTLQNGCIGLFAIDTFDLLRHFSVVERAPDTSPGASSILRI